MAGEAGNGPQQAFFYGLVHPQGYGWTFEQSFGLTLPDHDATAEVFIKNGKFFAIINAGAQLSPESFLNDLTSVLQGLVDALGFHLGVAMRVELLGGFGSPNRVVFSTRHAWPESVGRSATDPTMQVEAEELVPFTLASINEQLVRLALADICNAFVNATDTGFLCHRAVESIRQWYQDVDPPTNDTDQGWARLRTELGVGESDLRRLAGIAQRRRHGSGGLISEEERLFSIDIARRVVRTFVASLPTGPAEVP
jgi:hypothetical protein